SRVRSSTPGSSGPTVTSAAPSARAVAASTWPRTTAKRLSARGARRRRTAALGPGPAIATAQASRSSPSGASRATCGQALSDVIGRSAFRTARPRRSTADGRTSLCRRGTLPAGPSTRGIPTRGPARPVALVRRLVRAAATPPHVAGGDPPPRVDEPLPLGLGGLPAGQLGLHGVGDLRPGHAVGAQLADQVALVVVGEPAHLVHQRVPGRGGVAGERPRPAPLLEVVEE